MIGPCGRIKLVRSKPKAEARAIWVYCHGESCETAWILKTAKWIARMKVCGDRAVCLLHISLHHKLLRRRNCCCSGFFDPYQLPIWSRNWPIESTWNFKSTFDFTMLISYLFSDCRRATGNREREKWNDKLGYIITSLHVHAFPNSIANNHLIEWDRLPGRSGRNQMRAKVLLKLVILFCVIWCLFSLPLRIVS